MLSSEFQFSFKQNHFENLNTKINDAEVYVQKTADFGVGSVHSHDYIEIAFVQSGHGWHMLGNELSRCEPGR